MSDMPAVTPHNPALPGFRKFAFSAAKIGALLPVI